MNNEEKILAMLEQMNGRFDQLDARLDKMETRQDRMETRQDKMETRQDRMEAKLEIVLTEQLRVRQELDTLQGAVNTLNANVIRLENSLEPKINAMYEAIQGSLSQRSRVDALEDTTQDHGHRIFALEQVVKK